MSDHFAGAFEIEIGLPGAWVGHSAEHGGGVANEKVDQHLEVARALRLLGVEGLIFARDNASGRVGTRTSGRAFCSLVRVGLRRCIRSRAIRCSCGGFFFAPLFFLYDVFAQSAVFAEEAPVNNLKCFFLFRISHEVSF